MRCHGKAEAFQPGRVDAKRAQKVDWSDPAMRAKLANAYAQPGGDDEETARILGVSIGSARLAKEAAFAGRTRRSLQNNRKWAAGGRLPYGPFGGCRFRAEGRGSQSVRIILSTGYSLASRAASCRAATSWRGTTQKSSALQNLRRHYGGQADPCHSVTCECRRWRDIQSLRAPAHPMATGACRSLCLVQSRRNVMTANTTMPP